MHALARVFFQVQLSHTNPLRNRSTTSVKCRNLDPPMLRDRLVELRYLVALRRVRVKIILPRKNASLPNLTVDRPPPQPPPLADSIPAALQAAQDRSDRYAYLARRHIYSRSHKTPSKRSKAVHGPPAQSQAGTWQESRA